MKTQVWVDCDAGVDDAHALVMCLTDENVNCVGISCVFGNADLKAVFLNVSYVARQVCNNNVPVHKGAPRPYGITDDDDWERPSQSYGRDGLRGARDPGWKVPEDHAVLQEAVGSYTTAVRRLRDATMKYPNELVVVALGPLTNIAAAIKEDPSLPSKWKRLVVMGGSTDKVQFNFRADPAAAKAVIAAYSEIPSASMSENTPSSDPIRTSNAIISVQAEPGSLQLLLVTRECVNHKANKVSRAMFQEWGSQGPHALFFQAIYQLNDASPQAANTSEQASAEPQSFGAGLCRALQRFGAALCRACQSFGAASAEPIHDVLAMAVALYPQELGVKYAVQAAEVEVVEGKLKLFWPHNVATIKKRPWSAYSCWNALPECPE